MEKQKEYKPKAKKLVILDGQGNPSKSIELNGMPFTITVDSLGNPNVLAAIANYEKRTGRRVFGKFVVEG